MGLLLLFDRFFTVIDNWLDQNLPKVHYVANFAQLIFYSYIRSEVSKENDPKRTLFQIDGKVPRSFHKKHKFDATLAWSQ